MAVLIGHASIDERGKASGGKAGNQTGKELCIRTWYSKPWNKVIRAKDTMVATKIAKAMEQACANAKIGYDQSQRTTLYERAKEKKWDISAVTEACETDCSALVAVCVNAAGVAVSKDIYTGNEARALAATGKFEVLTESKYLKKEDYLKRGDILLKEGSHTAVVLTDGSLAEEDKKATSTNKAVSASTASSQPQGEAKLANTNITSPKKNKAVKIDSAKSFNVKITGSYIVNASSLNIRSGAGTSKEIVSSIPRGKAVQCYGYYNTINGEKWYLITYGSVKGYCSSQYLKKQ